jgi:two-component system sensor histidine kinase KdpD
MPLVVAAAALIVLVVLYSAVAHGTRPAFLVSFLGVLYLSSFYFEELSWGLAAIDDIVALAAFLATSMAVGKLSSDLRRKALEAEAARKNIQHLYDELQRAFEHAATLEGWKRSEHFKSALLDALAHDLRTPLTSIQGAASSIQRIAETDTSKYQGDLLQLARVVNEDSQRLDQFIAGMLDLARIEGATHSDEVSEAPVDELIDLALHRAQKLVSGREVTVSCSLSSARPRCSGPAVSQVFYTLIENAAKYSPPTSPIEIVVERRNEHLEASVEDRGPGVPVSRRDAIFERFTRFDVEGKAHVAGLGIGLTIAKRIVEAHGGRIWVEERSSSPGAKFVFTLPVVDKQIPELPDE